MIVDLEEFKHHLAYFKAINDCDLEKIIWCKDMGNNYMKGLTAGFDQVSEWKYTGLNNTNFPEYMGWI